ncbi:matrixin family metalloprotease [Stieleria varia]|uniref:Matrixin n=1 Tax=Stieleria varia TaxID=2528005 RepID=A0A5C6A1M1_9BACT|nr:matrixin family metalloprotease [Stieleria varia]TWT92433.1 Matrixin [Stieleria varia]
MIRRSTIKKARRQTQRRDLCVERLCTRLAFDGAGLGIADPLPWFDPGGLTYSFAPDGTSVANQDSRLFEKLDLLGAPSLWKEQFDAAFNAWLEPLNATIHEVPDSGSRFGVAGPTQGDARFGDIRIAAIPLSQNVYATSIPHSAMVQGSWAGDILINSDAPWSNLQDVFAVALHEFGHVLGLGHADDPASAMFVHGVHDVLSPTTDDIQQLQTIYAGIEFEESGFDHLHGDGTSELQATHAANTGDSGSSSVSFDLTNAESLAPSIGNSIRYSTNQMISPSSPPLVYRLTPTGPEAEGLENLHVSLQSLGTVQSSTEIVIMDANGRRVQSQALHHGQGSVVVQAFGVNSKDAYYVVVNPTVSAHASVGEFNLVADFTPELQMSRQVSEVMLDDENKAWKQAFNVDSSRLIHLHVDNSEYKGTSNSDAFVSVTVLDSNENVVTQVALRPGEARSAPVTFLDSGQYTIHYAASSLEPLGEVQLSVFIDEVSIDVGPGVANPTNQPYVPCSEPGSNPDYCYIYTPIYPELPTITEQTYVMNYPWWWEYGFGCSDYGVQDFEWVQVQDPLWWEFYTEACIAVPTYPTTPTNPTPTNPTPTNPTPTNPTPTNPTPTNPTPTNPTPTNPTPTNPTPTNPTPTNPTPTNPTPTNPTPTNPTPTNPAASPWQNLSNIFDVSGNDMVTAQDALIIINLLGRSAGRTIVVTNASVGAFADVNGDFTVTAGDALMVINAMLQARMALESEFVSAVAPPVKAPNGTLDGTWQAERIKASDAAIGMLF